MLSWTTWLESEKQQPYFCQIFHHIQQRKAAGYTVYPSSKNIFKAFDFTPLQEVKVVILGQDPYHGEGQAHGLSFSVPSGVKIPPSLRNIFKELVTDISGFEVPQHGNLQKWAEQGVLLLNTVLTVEEGNAHSHASIGWETFTDNVISLVNEQAQGVVFLLWGSHAQKKGRDINSTKHHVLCAPHPSPLSAHRGFFGCKHFSTTNRLLEAQNVSPINWQI